MATNRNKRLLHAPIHEEKPISRNAGILEVEASSGLVENQKVTEILPGYHTGTFQAISDGEQTLKASYLGDVKVTSITVKPIPSKLVSAEFTGDNEFVYQNETAEVLLTFDKPLTRGQVPTYRTNPNLMIAQKIVISEDLRSGVFVVMGVNPGEGKIFASLGGVDKDASITVMEAPAVLTRVLTKPNPLFEGSNVEVRLIHDKAPNRDLITIDVDPSFTIQGEIAVEGNDAVAVYKATTFGDYTVEAKSHKITKSAIVNVGKVMPKITNVVVPHSVLAGTEFNVEIEFDKNQYLELSDVEVIFDRNAQITLVEPLKLVDKKIIGKYKGNIAYTGNVVVKYLTNTYPEARIITVRTQAKVASVTFNPEKLVIGQTSEVTVTFDKMFEDDQRPIEILTNSYINRSKEFTLVDPDNVSGTFEITGLKEGQGVITLILGDTTTIHNINVGPKPPVLDNLSLGKSTIRKGERTSLICTFNKPEAEKNIIVEAPSNVRVYESPEVDGVTVTYEVEGLEIGETANITLKHKVDNVIAESDTKEIAITVAADAKGLSISGNNTPEYKSEVELTFTADKAKLDGQLEPEVVINNEEFQIINPFNWDEGNITGKLTVKPLKYEGTYLVSIKYGDITKSIEISPKKAEGLTINEVNIDYTKINIDDVATIVVTTNKPIAVIDEIPVEVNDFLTYNNDAVIESDNTMKVTITGKTTGAGVVTFKPNGGDKTQSITVNEAAGV